MPSKIVKPKDAKVPSTGTGNVPPKTQAKRTKKSNQTCTILIMGATGSGKSTFVNLLGNSHLDVGQGLKSCTNQVQSVRFKFSGRRIIVMDTPGFDDDSSSDFDILKIVGAHLSALYNSRRINAVIYMHRISDIRVGGTSRRSFQLFSRICGVESMKNVAIVTNMWNLVDRQTALARERELKTDELFFKPALDNGAKMYRHDGTASSARSILKNLYRKRTTSLALQKELASEKEILETSAGREVQGDVAALTRRHERELQEIREEMARALAEHDTVANQELSESRAEVEGRIRALQQKSETLPASFMQAREKAEEDLQSHVDNAAEESFTPGPRSDSPGAMEPRCPSPLPTRARAGLVRRSSTMILRSAGRVRRATTSILEGLARQAQRLSISRRRAGTL